MRDLSIESAMIAVVYTRNPYLQCCYVLFVISLISTGTSVTTLYVLGVVWTRSCSTIVFIFTKHRFLLAGDNKASHKLHLLINKKKKFVITSLQSQPKNLFSYSKFLLVYLFTAKEESKLPTNGTDH